MNITKPSDRVSLANKIGKSAIDNVVDDFYNQIQTHPTLSKPFAIVTHWKDHKEKISAFWWMALGGSPSDQGYRFDPVGKHFAAGFTEELLNDWKALFSKVATAHLDPDLAQAWQQRIDIIGENLLIQNNRLNQH